MFYRLLLLLLLASVATVANAQWVQTSGPYGAKVTCMLTRGSTIFAGTQDGLYRSTDNGERWSRIGTNAAGTGGNPAYFSIDALAAHGSWLFAGVDGTLSRSSDDGATWEEVTEGLPESVHVTSFASIGSWLFVGINFKGVFRSSDNGNTWTEVSTGLKRLTMITLAVHDTTLVAGAIPGTH